MAKTEDQSSQIPQHLYHNEVRDHDVTYEG